MEELVKELYCAGKTVLEITTILKISSWKIYNILKKEKIVLRGSGNSKFKRKNPFTEPSILRDYWLGYLMADGTIQVNPHNRAYRIVLYSKEIERLESFNNFMDNICTIKKWTSSDVYGAYFSSKDIVTYIINTFNIIPNKSLTLNPSIDLNWQILQGYFDGDGSIRIRNNKYGEVKFTTGSLIWKNRIKEFLNNQGIKCSIYTKGNAFDIAISNRRDIKKIFENFYTNTNCLQYKYKKFVALLSNE